MLFENQFKQLNSFQNLDTIFNKLWVGSAIPEGKNISVKLKTQFIKSDEYHIEAEMEVDDEGEILIIKLYGGIINLPYIVFDYVSTNDAIINYGRIFYKIESENIISGRVLGYSGERDFVVNGIHNLESE